MDQYIGKLLDNRYELLERIGNGGMSVVYKARCHRLNRLVAVKILKPDLASDAEFRRRFHDESQAVAMLSHANIVSVYDVSSSDDLDYIVMELIDGISLKQYMQKRGVPLNWREALHFTLQIVKALGHAHSRGIIHRDIKPHNVMVLRDGSIKVADFGIARLINGGESTLTQEALGSVHYISPEQARGSRIDGRSDLYSAGVVLYEMITGRLPFEGETPVSVAIQHINSIPISPRELNPDLPVALEAITMKAMAPKVEQRYASADDMLNDLEEFRKNPNVSIVYEEEKEEAADDPEEEVDEPTQVVHAVRIPEEEKVQSKEEPVKKQEQKPQEKKVRPAKQPKPKKQPKYEEDDDDYVGHRWSGFIAGSMAVLFILLFVCGIALFLWKTFFFPLLNEPETYTVPDVKGMTLSEIYADRSITGTFAIVEGDPIYDAEFALGEVVKQSPQAGDTVRESGLTITVQINTELSEEEVRMPDVMNWDQRKALSHLQDELGLDVTMEYDYSEEIGAERVMSFTPLDGALLKPGDPVTIVISKGPEREEVTVPLVEGMELEAAKEMLLDFELSIGEVKEIHNETVEAGVVVFQSIRATAEVAKGTQVDLHVSLGSANPNQTGSQSPDPSESLGGGDIQTGAVTKDISFNLIAYAGTVHLRVEVGNLVVMDGQVDTSIGTWTGTVSHTGSQRVNYYVNGELARSETINFSS